MISGSPRHIFRSRILRVILLALPLWTFFETLLVHRTLSATDQQSPARVNTEKIFITSLPWNNEIIFRTHLTNQIRDLIHALGASNLFFSIYENGSFDGTKDALRDLHKELEALGVRSRVILDDESHQDIVNSRPSEAKEGWIKVDKSGFEKYQIHQGDYALRRIYYLAELRNKVLEPLAELAAKGETFDKILFLNDVVFSADDVLNLLQTRNGQYAAACTLDFALPPAFYDTFALRDSDGYPALMSTWPFFRSVDSRNAMIKNEPIPVESCWNGIVAMDATPFYDKTNPLRFRGVPQTLAHKHVEGSECCLIHADNRLTSDYGIWINPNVRVGYCHPGLHKGKFGFTYDWDLFKRVCQEAYDTVHPASGTWVTRMQIARGLWENRIRRWTSMGGLENWKARRKLHAWESERKGNEEGGEMCLVDEMHIIEPHGWLHV